MKQHYFLYLSFILLLTNCGSDESNLTEEQDHSDETVEEIDPLKPYVLEDGAEVYPMSDGKSMIVQQVENEGCEGHQFNKVIDEDQILASDTTVERRGDSLIFKMHPNVTGESRQVVLVNSVSESDNWSEHGFVYEYQGFLESIEYWVVFAMGYENHKTVMIDRYSGKQTEMVGIPCVSPDRRFVLVGNADMEAAFTENHLSLYKWTSEDLELLVKAPLDTMDWAPYEVNWTDDYHFTIKQGRLNESNYAIDFNCAEVTIE